jgi:hypothetical protein
VGHLWDSGVNHQCPNCPAAGQATNETVTGAVCKTVGSAYVGSNPTPATVKPQVRAGDAGLRHRLFGAERSGLRTACSGLWAMRGPDPGAGGAAAGCCGVASDLRKREDGYMAGPREVEERSMAAVGQGRAGPWVTDI